MRVLIALAAVAALAVGFVLVRPDGADETETVAREPTTTATETGGTEPRPPRERPKVSEIAIREGTVVGGRLDATARKGDLVELRVYADVRDDVHLHGYDLQAPVRPDLPARLRFRATLTGRFEVELERRHLHVGRLTVLP